MGDQLNMGIQKRNYNMFFKLAIVCILQQITMVLSYPNHAQCELKWNIPGNCNDIGNRLIAQMNLWNDDSNCGKVSESCPKMPCGQNCLYTFVNATENGIINGIHTTPVKRYTDTISFKFQSYTSVYSERCFIDAFSSSDVSYAYLDYGTNYCNLRNLLDGAGISRANGFLEKTSTDVCTQYDQLNCARF